MSNYEPGTVAVATVYDEPNVRVFRSGKGWQSPKAWCSDSRVTDVRPLVVLDLDHPEHVATLIRNVATGNTLKDLADQIEAQIRPPKPEEPTGLGAVVEARTSLADLQPSLADLQPWVRDDKGWLPCGGGYGQYRNAVAWSSLRDVRVLSEGVKP